jgi:hypothetical protein
MYAASQRTTRLERTDRCFGRQRRVDASTRLKAALAIGSNPEPGLLDALLARCAIEPDFYVRDMLTWALTHFPSQITVPGLLTELRSERAQARSQALHTLSKIKDAGAWRAAVVLVPAGQEQGLAEELATQLGRGDRHVQLSLSRAFVALGTRGRFRACRR